MSEEFDVFAESMKESKAEPHGGPAQSGAQPQQPEDAAAQGGAKPQQPGQQQGSGQKQQVGG